MPVGLDSVLILTEEQDESTQPCLDGIEVHVYTLNFSTIDRIQNKRLCSHMSVNCFM